MTDAELLQIIKKAAREEWKELALFGSDLKMGLVR
jgi:hypothetical protein